MNNIISEIKVSNNIVLLCHNNPDGDAVGSTLAMYHLLKKIGKKVELVIEDVPTKFNFIEGYQEIKLSSDKKYNLAIILDTASIERLNNPNNIIENVDKKIVIDHHKNNTLYGDINLIDIKPTCCEIVYNLIKEMNVEIDKLLGVPLCTGMLTDTGGLSHPDVKPSTYKMAAALSEIVDIPSIHKKVLGTITREQFELKRLGMSKIEFYNDNKIAFTCINEDDLNNLGVKKNEADIIANLGRDIEDVEVAIYLRKYTDTTRVSLRSNNIDVSSIASLFGGGGHINTAGITTNIPFDELKEKLIKEVGKEIEKWNTSSK